LASKVSFFAIETFSFLAIIADILCLLQILFFKFFPEKKFAKTFSATDSFIHRRKQREESNGEFCTFRKGQSKKLL
jgi:hypothetical protein